MLLNTLSLFCNDLIFIKQDVAHLVIYFSLLTYQIVQQEKRSSNYSVNNHYSSIRLISRNYEVKIRNVGCRENLVSNRIVKEMKNYKDINFSCNTQDERFGLAENLNSEEREEFQSRQFTEV